MLLSRVTLGRIYNTKTALWKAKLAPDDYDSVAANGGEYKSGASLGKYSEFCLYYGDQIYHEYIVCYHRVPRRWQYQVGYDGQWQAFDAEVQAILMEEQRAWLLCRLRSMAERTPSTCRPSIWRAMTSSLSLVAK